MDGGCLDIWFEEELNESAKRILKAYERYVNSFSNEFSIRFQKPEIKTKYEEKQIKRALGHLPRQQLAICGWADTIFPAFEAIMRKYGGVLKIPLGSDGNIFKKFTGHWHKIKYRSEKGKYFTSGSYHLIDVEFVAGYFNELSDEKEKKLFDLRSMLPEIPEMRRDENCIKNHPKTIEKRLFLCESCGYNANVYGEQYFDHGCQNYIATFTCRKCKNLFEHIISEMTWEDNVSPIEYDLAKDIICMNCGSDEIKVWNKDYGTCPSCDNEILYQVTGEIKLR